MAKKQTPEEEKEWKEFEREQAIEFEKMIAEANTKKQETIKTDRNI